MVKPAFFDEHKLLRDILGVVVFILAVIIGAWLINLFLFRSFSVSGPSMEQTLFTGDRLIVNRLPLTWNYVLGKEYRPQRGQVIVFKNPLFEPGMRDEYIVKRVIGLPGERVVLRDGKFTVYNRENPGGFNPDAFTEVGTSVFTDGSTDTTVPEGELFVSGDHRAEGYSYDSRNGMGTIPLYDVIGPVGLRIYPFTRIRTF